MDNTPQPLTPAPSPQPEPTPEPTPIPTAAPTPPAPAPVITSMPPAKQKHSFGKFLLWLLVILLIAGTGALGYLYKTTNDKLKTQSQKLSSSYQTVEDFQAIIDANKESSDFVAKYNDAALSRNLCNGSPLAMFDVHSNDKFITFRYLCANQSHPIRIAAFAKHASGPTDFTYSATEASPNALPDYIFDCEPAFFGGAYGAIKS